MVRKKCESSKQQETINWCEKYDGVERQRKSFYSIKQSAYPFFNTCLWQKSINISDSYAKTDIRMRHLQLIGKYSVRWFFRYNDR